ncbi:MAG TPA: 5-dehydro-2-deoxygluconokinase [Trueperaceae bacterium]
MGDRRSGRRFDLITIGRSSIDLYANEIGRPFEQIESFSAYVGGSPTNIAVAARRLGLDVALLTGVGDDKVGSFILRFLQEEGIETGYVARKPGARSSAVLLGIEPPDRFPLVFYRDNAADMQITIDDVLRTPIHDSGAIEVSGTGLSREPSRSATFLAAERARQAGTTVYMDLDFRADQWHDPRAFGVNVRALLGLVDVAIGTEEEINAAMLTDPEQLRIVDQQVSAPEIGGDIDANIEAILGLPAGPQVLVVKRGRAGATVHVRGEEPVVAPGFPVEVHNILGAGDAFAGGLIYGRSRGWDWYRSARMGNACGAIVVTRHGCANFMAFEEEALNFVEERGGF